MPGRVAIKHASMDQTASLHFDSDHLTLLAELESKIFRSMSGVGAVVSEETEKPVAAEASP